MSGDWPWIWATVILNLLTATGYARIAFSFWHNRRAAGKGPAARLLGALVGIFAFCGICGYLSPVLELVWPARRYVVFARVILVGWTWYYAINSRAFRLAFQQLNRGEKLAKAVETTGISPLLSAARDARENAVSGHDLAARLDSITRQLERAIRESGPAGEAALL